MPDGIADTDDVVQQVYVELRELWPTVRDPGRFALGAALWPYIAAQVRELKRRSGIPLHGEGVDVPQPGPTMDEEILDQEIDKLLHNALPDALDQLPEKQRVAVELTVAGGETRTVAAAAIGVAEGTVSSHRCRGLMRLASILSPPAGTLAGVVSDIFDHAQHWF